MKKVLDVSQCLRDFCGRELRLAGEEGAATLQWALLAYCGAAGQMGLEPGEQMAAYEAGCLIGRGGRVALDQRLYDVMKKLADCGQVYDPAQRERRDLFGNLVKSQVKLLVDAAQTEAGN